MNPSEMKVDDFLSDNPEPTDVDLPEGWCETELRDVGILTTGNTPSRSNEQNFGNTYPWVKPPDLDQIEPITSTTEGLSKKGASVARLLRPGTVMVSCIGNLGKVGIAGTTLATNQQINSITFYESLVHPRYGFHYCRMLRSWLENQASATTLPIVNKSKLSKAPFLLAPQTEQRRIAQMIDGLLEQVNQTRNHLSRVPSILKRFRQAVLAAACSGRLTEDWRGLSANLPAKERSEYAEIDSLFDLPSSWRWVSLESVCEDITVGHVGPMAHEYQQRGIPFLRSQNVREFRFDSTGLRYVSEKFHLKLAKSALHPGDVVVVRSGYAGAACVIPDSISKANCADLVIIRPSKVLDPHYACIFINSNAGRAHVDEVKVGIAQSHFNIGSAKKTPVPLPPLAEQQEIVRRVHGLFRLAETVESRTAKATLRVNRLTQSILCKAFRGELVSTEAELARREGREYEHASVLLERIKKEREEQTSSKPKQQRKRTKAELAAAKG